MKIITILAAALFSILLMAAATAPSRAAHSPFTGIYSGTYSHVGKVVSGPATGRPGAVGTGVSTMTIHADGTFTGMSRGTTGNIRGNVSAVSGRISPSGAVVISGSEASHGLNIAGAMTGMLHWNAAKRTLYGTISGKSVDQYGDVAVISNYLKLRRR